MLYSEQPTNYSSAGVLILLNRKRTQTARVGVGCLNFVSRFGLLNNDKFFFHIPDTAPSFIWATDARSWSACRGTNCCTGTACVRPSPSTDSVSHSFIHSFFPSLLRFLSLLPNDGGIRWRFHRLLRVGYSWIVLNFLRETATFLLLQCLNSLQCVKTKRLNLT